MKQYHEIIILCAILLQTCSFAHFTRFTGNSFLANIGGALSLYLGVSLVSVFELFEIILRLTCYKNKTKKWGDPNVISSPYVMHSRCRCRVDDCTNPIRDRYTIITSSSTFIIVVFHKLLDQSEACRRKAPNSNLVPQNSYTFVTFPSQNCHIEWTIFKNMLSLFHHKIMSLLVKCINFFHHKKALVTFSSQNYAFVVSMYI